MKTKGLFLGILLFMGLGIMAQDAPLILVEGRVLSNSDSTPVPFAHVWGHQRNVGAITDSNGYSNLRISK